MVAQPHPVSGFRSPVSEFTPDEREALRLGAWLELPLRLLAPPFDRSGRRPSGLFVLRPLTGAQDRLLEAIGSPLRTGEAFDRVTLLMTLWLLSPDYRPGAWWRFLAWALNRIALPFNRTASALRRWDAAQFLDRPPREVGHATAPRVGANRSFALYALACKHRLRMSEVEVLSLPVARCLQQLTALECARGGETPHFDPERAAAVGAWLRARRLAGSPGPN
jgi:hypothetical protein